MRNYDNKAMSTGLEVSSKFAELEQQFILNRRRLFEQSIKGEFKLEAFKQLTAYREANEKAARTALGEINKLAVGEISRAYDNGVESVNKAVKDYIQDGFKPTRTPTGNNSYKALFVAAVIQSLAAVAQHAITAADNQLRYIIYYTDSNASDIRAEIDRVQYSLLSKGVPGKSLSNGTEKSMQAEGEFILRNQTQETLQEASGRQRNEWGINLVRVSAHPSSCPLCEPWQDKVLVDDRYGGMADGKHSLLSIAVDSGLWHYNCRHEVTPEVLGHSNPNRYKRDKADAKETATRYAIEQQQRYNERMIRDYKLKEIGSMSENAQSTAAHKVAEWQERQRALAKIAERENVPFYRQYEREQIGGKTKPTLPLGLISN